jgi:type I restriction-modification system DNA methylase subunit
MMEREAKIQDDLKAVIEQVAKGRRFHGIEITHVERDYPVDGREADLVLFMRGDVPFMFIETKRKRRGGGGALFDPLDVSVVGQVMSYAAIWKRSHPEHEVPYVATANPEFIVVFRVPKNVKDYIDWEALLKRDYAGAIKSRYFSILKDHMVGGPQKLSLTPEFIDSLLDRLAEELVEKKVTKPEPTEAMISRFRGFVDTVAERCVPLLESRLKEDEFFRREVEKLGYKTDPESLPQNVRILARMMAYVLMNKLIFRKILEESYRLPPMVLLDSSSRVRFMEDLNRNFDRAIEATKDFEPIFRTGVYDQIPIPDDPELMEYINDFICSLDSIEIVKIGDRIGYMYEVLIPPEERHQLGQFYTPPWVCELITKWCIRSPDDKVLDPGVGSGGFLLQAYKRLQELKIGSSEIPIVRPDIHERILSQLYALDINPFPAHLSAMAVSIKNIKVPSTKLNVLVSDFFAVQPGQKVLSPYKVKTIVREEEREIVLPKFDAVVGNPPYTRWTEIPDETQKLIRQRLGKLMKEYGLTPQVSRGVEPGIYIYWILHAHEFLKEGGRLGMIISNTWLQTEYGIGFANFLLDHFRIKAILDFALKLFKDALVTTCIVLAEKESDESRRLENEVAFMHIPGEVESAEVGELLRAVEAGKSERYTVKRVKQKDLPRDRKWIDLFFETVDISSHPLMTKLGELFEPLRGNTVWAEWSISHGKRPDPGSSDFHYLSPSKVREWSLEEWTYPKNSLDKAIVFPAITSARQTNFFTFTERDWEEMRKSDDKCYLFIGHVPREKLPKEVEDYIRWGETECRTRIRGSRGGGRLASETEAAKARVKEKKLFYDWYDLGGVVPAPIFAIYQAWHKTRFVWCKFPVVMYHALIALVPKKGVSLDETEIKALLAYLNSSFTQMYIETEGRKSPGGIIGFELNIAREMPVLDVRRLNSTQLNLLARLFEELESEARKIGGASTREQIEKLKPKIYEIDRAVAAILGIKEEDVRNMQKQVDLMVERRVSAARGRS